MEELLVKDVKTSKVVHMDKRKTVYEAACMMKEDNISSILVLDENLLSGIITERDITQKVVAGRLNPDETTIGQVMGSPVKTIESSKTLVEAARMMRELKIKKLVVIEAREVVGIISQWDILEMYPALLEQK